jgi:16S rRNA (guanine966-N2)-methyltransferase
LLVESASPALRVIRANIEALGLPGAEVVADRVERLLARRAGGPYDAGKPYDAGGPYDIVFADPPYAMPDEQVAAMLAALHGNGWLQPGALVIVERATRSREFRWPDGYQQDRARKYGEATFWYGLAGRALALDEE